MATLPLTVHVKATEPPPATGLCADIEYRGTVYRFSMDTGVDCGDYRDPEGQFTVTNVRAVHAGLPMFRVYFRLDHSGDREEVVFEYGNVRTSNPHVTMVTNADPALVTCGKAHGYVSGQMVQLVNTGMKRPDGTTFHYLDHIATVLSPTTFTIPVDGTEFSAYVSKPAGDNAPMSVPGNMAGYHVTISDETGVIHEVNVTHHNHRGRWRWQSAKRPVRKSLQQLIDAGLLPFMNDTVLGAPSQPKSANLVYTPMSYPDLSKYMPAGGVPDSIGWITEKQSNGLFAELHGDWFAQAEASGTPQWHYRDEATGAPLDARAPNDTLDSYTYSTKTNYIGQAACEITLDTGHEPCLCYVPFLLTGDPFYLEELQFIICTDITGVRSGARFKANGRYYAWPLRNALYAWKVTPDSVPSWLLPKSYFDWCIGEYAKHLDTSRFNAVDQQCMLWRVIPGSVNAQPGQPSQSAMPSFQNLFLSIACALAVFLGREDWRERAEWQLQSFVDLSSGKSGWNRTHPACYHILHKPGCDLAVAMSATDTTMTTDAFGAEWDYLGDELFKVTVGSERMVVARDIGNPVWQVQRAQDGTKAAAYNAGADVYGDQFDNHEDAWAANCVAQPDLLTMEDNDPTKLVLPKGSDYPWYMMTGLSIAVQAGLCGEDLAECQAWIYGQIAAKISSSYTMARRWMVVC